MTDPAIAERRAEIDRHAARPPRTPAQIMAAAGQSWAHRPAPQVCWCGRNDHSQIGRWLHLARDRAR